jgi:hypothetical protein
VIAVRDAAASSRAATRGTKLLRRRRVGERDDAGRPAPAGERAGREVQALLERAAVAGRQLAGALRRGEGGREFADRDEVAEHAPRHAIEGHQLDPRVGHVGEIGGDDPQLRGQQLGLDRA